MSPYRTNKTRAFLLNTSNIARMPRARTRRTPAQKVRITALARSINDVGPTSFMRNLTSSSKAQKSRRPRTWTKTRFWTSIRAATSAALLLSTPASVLIFHRFPTNRSQRSCRGSRAGCVRVAGDTPATTAVNAPILVNASRRGS